MSWSHEDCGLFQADGAEVRPAQWLENRTTVGPVKGFWGVSVPP